MPVSGDEGVNVAVLVPVLYATVPVTCVLPTVVLSWKVLVVMDVPSIGSLNVAVKVVFVATLEARSAGVVESTVGAPAVVNVQGLGITLAARPLPARSLAPVVTVAMYAVLGSRAAVGVNVAVAVATL